ncbi:helix-turn-helix domain-containing protein [Rahnella laticis]|uniref:helix-turn-helix domain-containing protein n=1 Tax=Rahnella laticis TaxID=2787622 RepID=UPI0018A32402|nr:helix-turn-helix transcriptional regulator [Rahnella laticis]MBF7993700.1 hypothetical protein [Rahnella laticis]
MFNVLIYTPDVFVATAVKSLCTKIKTNKRVGVEHCQSYHEVLHKAREADYVFYDDNDGLWNTIRKLFILKRLNPELQVLSLKNGQMCDFDNIVYTSVPSSTPFKERKVSFLENKIKNIDCDKTLQEKHNLLNQRNERIAGIPTLSQRENLILKLILKGRRNGEISRSLDISEKTVSTHRRNIYKKINVHNLSELYRLFM